MRLSHPCWPRLRGPLLLAVLVSSLALGGCEPESGVTIVRPTPTSTPVEAADQTPESKGTPLVEFAPEELAKRLLGGIDPLPGLPPTYRVETSEIILEEPTMPKLARGVRYTLDGPDLVNSVTYYIHTTPADAHEDLGAALNGPFPSERLDGLGYPARVVSSGSADSQVGTTIIYITAGQTIIESVSSVAGTSTLGNLANATEQARIAIAHLSAVAPPAPTPTPEP